MDRSMPRDLLVPKNATMLAVERALLRGPSSHASPPVAEQVAARLAGLIVLDRLRPGERLLENDLCRALGISRSPVREALRILERDRLVELQARRGATVTAPNARELHDIFTVRTLLFTMLLTNIMQARPQALQDLLGQHLSRLAGAALDSPEAYALQSFLVNLSLADLGDNRLVVDQLKALSLRTLRYVRLGLAAAPHTVAASLASWRALRVAVIQRDTQAVLRLAAQRIETVHDASVTGLPAHALVDSPHQAR